MPIPLLVPSYMARFRFDFLVFILDEYDLTDHHHHHHHHQQWPFEIAETFHYLHHTSSSSSDSILHRDCNHHHHYRIYLVSCLSTYDHHNHQPQEDTKRK
ncbi:hypothetical protein DERF_011162 [Dermatophagoides farinae]|uniref:Uncharacterized protein n=1 Tax=Dermatophagoides farinae TaxID=6954 RepID=A0A922HUE8_DERFA|nr:hypothetical protein DERF_011162 [Dermatophagoides farinae]